MRVGEKARDTREKMAGTVDAVQENLQMKFWCFGVLGIDACASPLLGSNRSSLLVNRAGSEFCPSIARNKENTRVRTGGTYRPIVLPAKGRGRV